MIVALIIGSVVVGLLLVFEIRGLIKDIKQRKSIKKINRDEDNPSK